MVGASLALIMANALPGRRLVLIESKPFNMASADQPPMDLDGRSTALTPSSVELMKTLGIWHELAVFATAINSIHVSDRGRWGLSQFERADNDGAALGYVLENNGFNQVLQAAVRSHPDIEVRAPVEVDRVVPAREGMSLQLGEESLPAELVLVADGADSRLRAQLGIDVSERPYQQYALVANVTYSQPHQGRAFERFTPAGPLALLPLGRKDEANVSALVWTIPDEDLESVKAATDTEILARLQTTFGYRLGRFTSIGRRSLYPLRLVVAQEQVRSGVVLMGNAAHFLHPVAGQGFNLALRDAVRLAETLVAGQKRGQALGDLALLETYLQGQVKDQWRTIFLSDSFNRVFTQTAQVWRWGRDLAMLTLESSPALRRQFINQLSGKTNRLARPWG